MTSESWEKAKELFSDALGLSASERAAMLDEKCGDDAELRAEVESLLTADAQPSTLFDAPVADIVAGHMADSNADAEGGLKIGTTIDGRYLIERELGRGGMGTVYLAERTHMLGDKVVVKVLLAKHLQNTYVVKKFRQEMESLLRLDHPGIVSLLDAGQTPQAAPYLVMKYVEGRTLEEEIPPAGMELRRAASIIGQLGEALGAAHEEKIIHRDLKPKNVMLCKAKGGEEQVKVIDFGVAKIRDSLVAPSTVYQLTVGTASYMSPEQLEGKTVTPASDIYALGVIAYQLVTGRRPFAASEYQLLEMQRAGVRLRPSDLCPGLPKASEDAVLKALAFKPQDRYQSARAFAEDFRRAIEREGEEEPEAPKVAGGPLRKIGAAFLIPTFALLALLAAGAVIFWKTRPEKPPPSPPARELSYWIEVLKYRGGKPSGQSFRLAGEINFEKDYRVRLHVKSPRPGYLYILNERPSGDADTPAYNLLFPDPAINGGSALVGAEGEARIPPENWFAFDEEEGVEKVWLIFSAESLAEIEAVRGAVNPDDRGFVRDRARSLALQKLISERAATSNPEVSKDDELKETRIRVRSDVLVHLIKLEHH